MALKGLPAFSCLPEDRGQHRTTTHLLPGDEQSVLGDIQRAFADASAGRLPDFPTIEARRGSDVRMAAASAVMFA